MNTIGVWYAQSRYRKRHGTPLVADLVDLPAEVFARRMRGVWASSDKSASLGALLRFTLYRLAKYREHKTPHTPMTVREWNALAQRAADDISGAPHMTYRAARLNDDPDAFVYAKPNAPDVMTV
jgi:hypothetical protein